MPVTIPAMPTGMAEQKILKLVFCEKFVKTNGIELKLKVKLGFVFII